MERRNFQGANRKHNSDLSVCHTAHTHPHTFGHAVEKKKNHSDEKTKVTVKSGKWDSDLSVVERENSPSASACWAAPQSTTSKASMTRTEREREHRERERGREMETWREECWEDEPIQAEACWHVRSLCTVFCVCFYLQQTERAYEKCAVGLTHRVSECAGKKLKILLFF